MSSEKGKRIQYSATGWSIRIWAKASSTTTAYKPPGYPHSRRSPSTTGSKASAAATTGSKASAAATTGSKASTAATTGSKASAATTTGSKASAAATNRLKGLSSRQQQAQRPQQQQQQAQRPQQQQQQAQRPQQQQQQAQRPQQQQQQAQRPQQQQQQAQRPQQQQQQAQRPQQQQQKAQRPQQQQQQAQRPQQQQQQAQRPQQQQQQAQRPQQQQQQAQKPDPPDFPTLEGASQSQAQRPPKDQSNKKKVEKPVQKEISQSHSEQSQSSEALSNVSSSEKDSSKLIAKFSSCSIGNTRAQYNIPRAASIKEKMTKLGTLGRKIKVRANHYELKLQVPEVHQYQVSYKLPWKRDLRKTDSPLLFDVIEKTKREIKVSPASIVFDGQYSMYSIHKLPPNFVTKVSVREIPEDAREVEFEVTIKHVDTIDISDSLKDYLSPSSSRSKCEMIAKSAQVLNVILGMSAQLSFTTIGRSIYNPKVKGCVHDIESSGKSLWQGTFVSVRFAWKPFLNVDMANKPGYSECPIEEFASKCCTMRGRLPRPDEVFRDYRSLKTVEDELKGLKVRFKRPDNSLRDYRFNKFVKSANEEKVEIDGKKMKIVDYYQSQYNYKLRYPNWPCLHVGNPKATIYLPPELCILKTQACPNSKKLSDVETANMIRKTAVAPMDRKKIISTNLKSLNDFFSKDKYANEFGISMSKDMTLINARVLDPPKLEYNGGKTIGPRDGKWNAASLAFQSGKALRNWALLDTIPLRPNDSENFVNALYQHGRTCGLEIDFPKKFTARGRDLNDVVKQFKLAYQELSKGSEKPQLIMIFMDNRGPMYAALKELGVLSPQTIHNICLKLNSKLGGTNQILPKSVRPQIMCRPVMMVGADVTHPSPDQRNKPSIAAVVASYDPNASLYNVQVRVQVSRKNNAVCEVIIEMEDIMKKLLMEDGVSEGQFQDVLDKEMSAIRRACLSIDANYKPGVTFLVAQKRHKTRLFPENPNDGVGKMRNIPPGTVVDTDIVHPTEYDFFLASHEGIQGTTKPTHYHLLWDDNNLSMDLLQTLTYYLCHLYSRCERSVSYPAPTYYAHLAAFRARHHHNRLIDMNLSEDPKIALIFEGKSCKVTSRNGKKRRVNEGCFARMGFSNCYYRETRRKGHNPYGLTNFDSRQEFRYLNHGCHRDAKGY
ncbi:ELF2C [Lepeophtheirus salmonis]|uniref:ELF2C n=1 Tax=Lepeophtheirus salmonis TaxID=72036 RepID=A0A7R8HCX9_LEPSM|nr:ELF2C [Lepeophtheirus salmonis]CAF3019568.1 ELF2C [Lepeophtheirus salmonis]